MLCNRIAALACGLALAAATCVALLAAPATYAAATAQGASALPPAETGWHGRAIRAPHPRHAQSTLTARGAGRALRRGLGYHSPGGSDRVREIQRKLTQLGYRPGPIDGRFGPRTRGAVRWFQIKHGFAPNGVVGLAALRHLRDRAAGRDSAPADGTPETTPAVLDRRTPATDTPATAVLRQSEPRIDSTVMTALLAGLVALGVTVVWASYVQARRRLGAQPVGAGRGGAPRAAAKRPPNDEPTSTRPHAGTPPDRGEPTSTRPHAGTPPDRGAPTSTRPLAGTPPERKAPWNEPPPEDRPGGDAPAVERRVIGGAR